MSIAKRRQIHEEGKTCAHKSKSSFMLLRYIWQSLLKFSSGQSRISKMLQYNDLEWGCLGFGWNVPIISHVWGLKCSKECSCMKLRLCSAQIYMKRWNPACWEACRKLSSNNLSPNLQLYSYIQNCFPQSPSDKQVHIRRNIKKEAVASEATGRLTC